MVLHWGRKEVFKSSVGVLGDTSDSEIRYYWRDESTSILLSSSDEILNTKLSISLYDLEIYGQGEFLGFVVVDFVSLLTLNDGVFEYKLRPKNSSQRYIRGSITFCLKFHIPIWDSMSMKPSSMIRRRISVVAVKNSLK